jgi:exodeoxyribonuclease VIII
MKERHLMVDLETLAVSPKATVLTLGAVIFDPFAMGYEDHLYIKIDVDEQDTLGREVDPSTVEWWSKQNSKVMEEAFDLTDRYSVKESMDMFHKFARGCTRFWSHGSSFDLVILTDMMQQIQKSTPWQYWQFRDTRTIFDLGHDPEMPQDSKHNALEDAIRQAVGVQNIYRKLKIEKNK